MQANRRLFLKLVVAAAVSPGLAPSIKAASAPGLSDQSPVNQRGDLRVGLISDLNGPYGTMNYSSSVHRGLALLSELQPDLVLCAGDMVAGQKRSLQNSQLQRMWSSFESTILDPLLKQEMVLIPTMGNHDASSLRGGSGYFFERERLQAEAFWDRQKNRLTVEFIDASQYPFQFSFRRPGLFVVVIDASSSQVDGEQLQWLEQALASDDRSPQDFCIVMGHLPLTAVSVGRDRAGECISDASALADVMRRRRVDLYVSGHHHAWYPGELLGQRVLSLGAMGNGPRRLLGGHRSSDPSLTLIDLFPATQSIRETTFSLNTFKPISTSALPIRITSTSFPDLRRRQSSWIYGS